MVLPDTWIDGDTLFDVSVNLIPIAILLCFVVLFAVITPWPSNLLLFAVGHALTIIPIVLLALLTYVAAKAFTRSESDISVREASELPAKEGADEGERSSADR